MLTVHDGFGLWWDLSEETQLKSLSNQGYNALGIANFSDLVKDATKQIKHGKLPSGCVSKHCIEDYIDEKKEFLCLLHETFCHTPTKCYDICGIALTLTAYELHKTHACSKK